MAIADRGNHAGRHGHAHTVEIAELNRVLVNNQLKQAIQITEKKSVPTTPATPTVV